MAQERSSGGSFVIIMFLLLSCNNGNPMNECFAKSRHGHLLFAFLFMFVSPIEYCSLENFTGPWRLTIADLQTFGKKGKQVRLLTM
jgi:hypothetical protein